MDVFFELLSKLRLSYERIGRPRQILAALSGGADSVALLLLLLQLQKEEGFTLTAAHVNHGLRENAICDEQFCKRLCAQKYVPLIIKQVSISPVGSVEANARTARYKALNEAMRECGAEMIALAHHMDDQAETLLLHLLHGAGVDGLSGMQELNTHYWRPLLKTRSSDLRAWLAACNQIWCEDESNADTILTRNAIRHDLIPYLQQRFSSEIVPILSRTCDVMTTEKAYFHQTAKAFLAQYASKSPHSFILVEPLQTLHLALKRHVLRLYAQRMGIALDFSHTEWLCKLVNDDGVSAINLPCGWRAMRSKERLHFISPAPSAPYHYAKESISVLPFDGTFGDGQRTQAINDDLFAQCQLRTRQTGDWIQPFGMHGKQKLKEYLIDRKIDQPFRDAWPLLCMGSEVLWVIGVGASERLRGVRSETNLQLLEFKGNLPDQI